MNDGQLTGLLPPGVRRPPGISSGGYAFVPGAYLGNRLAVEFEVPVIAHARKCERERGLKLLAIAGRRTEDGRSGRPQGVPLARQAPELQARKRNIDLAPLS